MSPEALQAEIAYVQNDLDKANAHRFKLEQLLQDKEDELAKVRSQLSANRLILRRVGEMAEAHDLTELATLCKRQLA